MSGDLQSQIKGLSNKNLKLNCELKMLQSSFRRVTEEKLLALKALRATNNKLCIAEIEIDELKTEIHRMKYGNL